MLLFPAVILTGFAFVAAVLYRLSKKYPAVATQLKNCTFNIENQIRVKQVSTFFQVMGIVASLGMPLPSWFRLSFENLIVFVTWPFSFQPACIELIDVRTSTRGLLLFVLTMCFTYGLRRLYHIKLLRQCLPLSLFKNAQVAAGIIFSVSSIMLLTSTLRTTELKDGIFHLQGDTNAGKLDKELSDEQWKRGSFSPFTRRFAHHLAHRSSQPLWRKYTRSSWRPVCRCALW